MEIEINWTVPYYVLLTPVDVEKIRTSIIAHMNKFPNFNHDDLREIVWDYIENHYDYSLSSAFGVEQCDEVLNKILQGYGVQLSMFDRLGRIVDGV